MHIGLQLQALWYTAIRLVGPITITDWYGITMRVYPYEQTPIKKLITRENYHHEFEMYRKYAHGIVLDIGANIGIHSVYLARLAEKVYAFEPVSDTYKRLEETVRINHTSNVYPILSAVGNTNTTTTMQIFERGYSSWNSLGAPDSSKKPITTETVPMVTLDTWVEREHITDIGFMKIDVEGYELGVLEGATKLLSEHRVKALSFEVTRMQNKNPEPIFKLLHSYGYILEAYDPTLPHHNYYAVAPTV